jgi:ApaG protein
MSVHHRYAMQVEAIPTFIPEKSDIARSEYVFSYHIRITNTGTIAAQLISRHWHIIDAHDEVQEVRGLGVVGEQPMIEPGATYEYASGTMLATPVGTMRGHYYFTAEDGTQFEVEIPSFTLAMPRVLH